MKFSTNINTIFEIHDPKKLKFLKNYFEQIICLIFMIKKHLYFFECLKMEYLWPIIVASFWGPISKNQTKSLKPGHHIAKILLFRTHHLWNSTTELILIFITKLSIHKHRHCTALSSVKRKVAPKLYTPRTLNIDLIQWHTHVKSWFKSWVFPFTFQAYILPHTLNCMCVSLFRLHIWILEQF